MENTPTVQRPAPTRAPATGDPGDLRRRGFARFHAEDLGLSLAAHAGDLAQLTAGYAHLPADPYAPTTHRYRRYAHAVYLPWTRQLSFAPGAPDEKYGFVTEYWQDGHNPEYPDVRRQLPDIPAALRDNALLLHLIHADIAQVAWLPELQRVPVYVGVHLIKLAVQDPTEVAVSSPDCLHQDGGSEATFTFAHLVSCTNISGGENVIARPECAGSRPEEVAPDALHARFTLTEPLDGYAVHDHRVSHYVGPVRLGDGPGHGDRRILIIGLAPYAPRL